MGDRANVRFKQGNERDEFSFYLYAHWAGRDLHETIRAAFSQAEERWTDELYCTAFLVGQALKDYANKGELLSWGLGGPGDNEHDVLEIDFEAQKVRLRSREGWHDLPHKEWERTAAVVREWTFAEFAKLVPGAIHQRKVRA